MIRSVRKSLFMLVGLPMALGLQGCDDRDLAIGLGAVAIGVGAVAIGMADQDRDHHHHRRPRCEGGYVRRCSTWYDRRGYSHTDCRREYDSCARVYNMSMGGSSAMSSELGEFGVVRASAQLGSTAVPVEHPMTTELAASLNISFESANELLQAFEEARGGQLQRFYDLGFSGDDLRNLARFKAPTSQGLQKFAQNLNLSAETAAKGLGTFTKLVRDQVRNPNSEYWQACFASKVWQTNMRSYCRSASERGCTPQTGAQYCLAQQGQEI